MATKTFYSQFADVNIPGDLTLSQVVLQRARTYGDKVALIDGVDRRQYTYSEVLELVGRVASGLHRRGVKKGQVILLCTANCIEYPIILLGATSIGAIVTTSSPFYTTNELYDQMKDSDTIYVISSQDAAGKIKAASDRWGKIKARFVLGEAEEFESFADVMRDSGLYPPAVEINVREDTMILPYSSGTTGKPKGVMLTHHNLVSNLYQVSHPEVMFDTHPGEETYVCFVPFFHIYGITIILFYGLCQGNTIVVLPRFDLASYLKAIQDFKATILHIVPPIAVLLTKNPLVGEFDFSSVHSVMCGAAPMGRELAMELMGRLRIKNVRQGYGLTESSPGLVGSPLRGWRHGAAGMLLPNTLSRIIDVETGKDLDVGQEGELWFKGPQVMKGYLGRPDATAATVDKDGWIHTGDIGHVDLEGNYYIVDRLKELIKYKGLQVAPSEIESMLLTHPSIGDAAVIGVPDLEAGELPRAFCVKKTGTKVSEDDIIKFVAGQVSPHKRLRGGVEFIAEVPKSPSGKILRRILRDKAKNLTMAKL